MQIKTTHIMMLIISICFANIAEAQIIGDSLVYFSNNWPVGDKVEYESISYKQKILNSDTITEEVSSLVQTKVSLIDICQNGDKIFEIKSKVSDTSIGNLGRKEVFRPYYEEVMKMSEKPLLFLTNQDGSVKDMIGYDCLINDLDSLETIFLQCTEKLDWEKELKRKLVDSTINQLRESMSKQSLIDQCEYLQFYGKAFNIGSIMYNDKIVIPFLNNQIIDTTTELTCEVLLKDIDCEIVKITTTTFLDSDQIIGIFRKQFLSDPLNFRFKPDVEYPGLIRINSYLLDLTTSTMLESISKTISFTNDESKINFSIIQVVRN